MPEQPDDVSDGAGATGSTGTHAGDVDAGAAGPSLLRQISKDHGHKSSVDLLHELRETDSSSAREEAAPAAEAADRAHDKEAKPAAVAVPATKPKAGAAPPALVRGKTGLMKKRNHAHDSIAALVAHALPSWTGIDAEEIEVSDVSGHGGSKTFKVIAPDGTEPSAVAIHSRSESVTSEDISEARLAAAAAALLSCDVAPRRLAQGGDWYIVAWAGKALGSPFGACEGAPEELGQLLAKIHSVRVCPRYRTHSPI